MTPESLAQARALIGRTVDPSPGAPTYRAFSFDIFDTFLMRRCTGPDGVYERAFQLAPVPAGKRGLVESFVQHRMLAEHKARFKRWEQGLPLEVTIDEIYAQFATRVFGLSNTDRPALARAEFQAELDLCRANPDMVALFRNAQAAGLKAGFLSDTYWSSAQLAELLIQAAPDLTWDFLYASCEHGVGKGSGLFDPYLSDHALAPEECLHIGDNGVADVLVPEKLGLKTIHYPQAPAPLGPILQREQTMMQMLQSQRGGLSRRLDGGLTWLRRIAAAEAGIDPRDPYAYSAHSVVGPVMAAFQRFIKRRVAQIRADGRRAAVLFLARDGFLPLQVWEQDNAGPAHYIEINRRVALVGCADNVEPLQDLFKLMGIINESAVDTFLKTKLPSVSAYFRDKPGQISTGMQFARALPDLITEAEMHDLSLAMRDRMIAYLRHSVADFDACTDLILVDLGYGGTIQRALRGLFDHAGLPHALHGVYLATVDDAYAGLPDQDSAVGLLDDAVLTPLAKRVLLRNIAVIEQFCSAPVGSVRDYDGALPLREPEIRAPEQLAFAADMQRHILNFARSYGAAAARLGFDPLQDADLAAAWSAALLGRFLLLPTAQEQEVFGQMQHDVNLGSRALIDMIDAPAMADMLGTMPFPQVCAAKEPPMWLAGSLSTVSPMAGYAYALAGFGLLGGDQLAELRGDELTVSVIKNQEGQSLPASRMTTGFGEIRLRIPVLRRHTGSVVAIPLNAFMASGVIRSLTVQQGSNSVQAMGSRLIQPLPLGAVRGLDTCLSGQHFRADGEDAHLLIDLPEGESPLSILTLTVTPLAA